jgi:hypothetical protein
VLLKAIKIKEIRFFKAVSFILLFVLLIPYLILAIESLFVTLNVLFPGEIGDHSIGLLKNR